MAIGATNLLFTMIAMSVIDKIGRKTLLLIGSVGTAVCLARRGATSSSSAHHEDLLVWLLVGFIAFFAFSQGAVIWVYLSEVFPNRVRAKGQSLGSFTHWIMNALISGIFPVLAARSGGGPFVFFAAMMVVQFFVVLAVFIRKPRRYARGDAEEAGDRLAGVVRMPPSRPLLSAATASLRESVVGICQRLVGSGYAGLGSRCRSSSVNFGKVGPVK